MRGAFASTQRPECILIYFALREIGPPFRLFSNTVSTYMYWPILCVNFNHLVARARAMHRACNQAHHGGYEIAAAAAGDTFLPAGFSEYAGYSVSAISFSPVTRLAVAEKQKQFGHSRTCDGDGWEDRT